MVSPRKGRWIEMNLQAQTRDILSFLPVRGDGLK